MSNNFLGSTVGNSDLATETTSGKILDKLNTGLSVTGGTIDVGNFPSVQDIQTNGLVNKVQVAIDAADQTGSLDVVFPSTQNIQTNGLTDKVQVAIAQSDITGSIPVSASISSVTITDIDTTGGGQTSNLNIDISGQTLSQVVTNLTQMGGNNVTTGNGVNTNAQRVVISNDNDDIPIKNGTNGRIQTENRDIDI